MATPPSLKRPLGEDGPGGPSKKPKAGPDQEKIQKTLAEARARASAVASKLAARNSANAPSAPQPATAAPVTSAADRMAALRSRIASAVGRSSAATTPAHRSHTPQYIRREEHERDDEAATRARGGLDVGLHPALLGDSLDAGGARKGKNTMQPKFATTMANRRDGGKSGKKQLDLSGPSPELTDPTKNPYYDPNIVAKPTQSRRVSKALMFNQKGKYIEQANAMRRQEALEEMKKRIAVAARKVGIDEEIHADKAFAVSSSPSPYKLELWTYVRDNNCHSVTALASRLCVTGTQLDIMIFPRSQSYIIKRNYTDILLSRKNLRASSGGIKGSPQTLRTTISTPKICG